MLKFYCTILEWGKIGLLHSKTQIFPFKNGVSFLGFHTYVTANGKVIRKLANTKKRNAQRKYLRFARCVADGKASKEKLSVSFVSWKNHTSHGNCYNLTKQMEKKIKSTLEKKEDVLLLKYAGSKKKGAEK